ncbi:MAG: hypothetical protein V3U56_13545 [Syntrophobacteria bacterium]
MSSHLDPDEIKRVKLISLNSQPAARLKSHLKKSILPGCERRIFDLPMRLH